MKGNPQKGDACSFVFPPAVDKYWNIYIMDPFAYIHLTFQSLFLV